MTIEPVTMLCVDKHKHRNTTNNNNLFLRNDENLIKVQEQNMHLIKLCVYILLQNI